MSSSSAGVDCKPIKNMDEPMEKENRSNAAKKLKVDKCGPINENRITKMSGDTYELISSAQIVTNIDQAVRELMDNALDAGATCIEIRLKDKGLSKIEVSDNGCGISKNDFELLGVAHATSKIADPTDLQNINTHGFRGQALHNFASFSNLTILTRTEDSDVGHLLKFANDGTLEKVIRKARQVGTTVTISDLFVRMPVRRKELQSKADEQINSIIYSVEAYAVAHPHTKFLLNSDKGRLFFSSGGKTNTIVDILKVVFKKIKFTRFQGCLPSKEVMKIYDIEKYNEKIKKQYYRVHGYISFSEDHKIKSLEQEFVYVNRRHVKINAISKIIKTLTKDAKLKKNPIVVLFVTAKNSLVNVTYSATKREVGLQYDVLLHGIFHQTFLNLIDEYKSTFSPASKILDTSLNSRSRKRTTTALDSSKGSFNDTPVKKQNIDVKPRQYGLNNRSSFLRNASSSKKDVLFTGLSNMPTVDDSDDDVIFCGPYPDKQPSIKDYARPVTSKKQYSLSSPQPSANKPVMSTPINMIPRNLKIDFFTSTPDTNNDHAITGTYFNDDSFFIDQVTDATDTTTNINDDSLLTEQVANTTHNISHSADLLQGLNIIFHTPVNHAADVKPSPKTPVKHFNDIDVIMMDEPQIDGNISVLNGAACDSSFDMSLNGFDGREITEEEIYMDLPMKKSRNKRFDFFDDDPLQTGIDYDTADQHDTGHERTIECDSVNDRFNNSFNMDSIPDIDTHDISGLLERGTFQTGCEIHSYYDIMSNRYLKPDNNEPSFSSSSLLLDSSFFPTFQFKDVDHDVEEIVEHPVDDDVINEYGAHVERLFNPRYMTYYDPEISSLSMDLSMFINRDDENNLPVEENELGREVVLKRDEFLNITPHWQFNKGFILCTYNRNLFIVDQHAADEKYNFEDLLNNTKILKQPLVKPFIIAESAVHLNMISTYQEQLLRAGYTLSINGTADVKLLTIPSYFGKCLNMDDFYEILEKIDEQPTASKHITKSMYYACATKACHKAIRFGDSLTTKQMKDVVCNLKKLANPWECPHGRPTIRLFKMKLPQSNHLIEISNLQRRYL